MSGSRLHATTLLVVVLVTLMAVPANAEPRRLAGDCASITAWVAQNADRLPRTYDEVSEYPVPYRRAIFNALPNEEKSELWRTHLQQQLEASDLDLTPEQRRLIEQAMDLASPDLYADKRGGRIARLRMAAFQKAVREKFDSTVARRVFEQLGTDGGGEIKLILVKQPACSCSSISDYCPDGHGCDETAGCNVVADACGTLWTYDCDGLCVDPSANTN